MKQRTSAAREANVKARIEADACKRSSIDESGNRLCEYLELDVNGTNTNLQIRTEKETNRNISTSKLKEATRF